MSEASSTPEAMKPSGAEEQSRESLSQQIRLNRMQVKKDHRRGLFKKTESWWYYGRHIKEYQEEFRGILGGDEIVNIVRDRPSPVVIDFMGLSDTLASLFKKLPKEKPRFWLAISLEDKRNKRKRKRDNMLNIEQLAGDITEASTWREINARLQGRKADLIMERATMGLAYIPIHPKFYSIAINKAWQMLSEQGGMILAQVPSSEMLHSHNIPFKKWIEYLRENGIDASYKSANPAEDAIMGNGGLSL